MTQDLLDLPGFKPANSETLEKNGYHKPKARQPRHLAGIRHGGCGCWKTTEKGAYRDVVVRTEDGKRVRYYHQTPVFVKKGNLIRLNTGGYRTSTTKERINRELPPGYRLVQRDREWFIKAPNSGFLEYRDGVQIDLGTGVVLHSDGSEGFVRLPRLEDSSVTPMADSF